MIWRLLLCAALTAALSFLICLAWGRLLLPLRAEELISLLPAAGDGRELEKTVRACLLLRRWGLLRQSIVIVDQGLNEEGRLLARQLEKLDDAVFLLQKPSDLI